MRTIHKIAAMVIRDDSFLMVRKRGKDVWTNLGGGMEEGETEEETLIRETKEELDCGIRIIRKLGDFDASTAIFDDAQLKLSVYLAELEGEPRVVDPELEEFSWIGPDWKEKGIKLPDSITEEVIPFCLREKLLSWSVP